MGSEARNAWRAGTRGPAIGTVSTGADGASDLAPSAFAIAREAASRSAGGRRAPCADGRRIDGILMQVIAAVRHRRQYAREQSHGGAMTDSAHFKEHEHVRWIL